jgi:metal-dependent amidase/aminoacylase/carboxypeptidase family protein
LGNMGIVKGKLFGSFDKFIIKVIGKDAHGCTPERGVDPITTSALIVSALQNIVSREIIADLRKAFIS